MRAGDLINGVYEYETDDEHVCIEVIERTTTHTAWTFEWLDGPDKGFKDKRRDRHAEETYFHLRRADEFVIDEVPV